MKNEKSFIDIGAKGYKVNGTYKYYVGSEINKDDADKMKNKMRQLGFDGAFIVPFYKDVRISMKEALDLQTKKSTYE